MSGEGRPGGAADRRSRGGSAGFAVLAALIGIAAGTAGFTFVYGHGGSYLHDDPAACVNCHIMDPQFDGWLRGSHRSVATCNDCHTPKPLVAKYVTKARNGFWHSFHFTRGDFEEPIRIKPSNRAVTQARCRSCHGDVVAMMEPAALAPVDCLRCHATVGHAD
ncbi:MAG: cytochrome c nitrite reductase small subunit [Gemmatimonadota bacterium]|nr:cytochrome c nitrite reductase small subunit [Gemmatimonadota bacterium]